MRNRKRTRSCKDPRGGGINATNEWHNEDNRSVRTKRMHNATGKVMGMVVGKPVITRVSNNGAEYAEGNWNAKSAVGTGVANHGAQTRTVNRSKTVVTEHATVNASEQTQPSANKRTGNGERQLGIRHKCRYAPNRDMQRNGNSGKTPYVSGITST